jgi:hypothetical protein
MGLATGVKFPAGAIKGFFLFTTASRSALGINQPPIQWVTERLSAGVKRPERDTSHSHPSSAEFKDPWSYISTHLYVFMAWELVKHTDNFTLPHSFTSLTAYIWFAWRLILIGAERN